MILGYFRDGHPRMRLALPGRQGARSIEVIIDTGFEGDLAIPQPLILSLEAQLSGADSFALADGSRLNCPVYEMLLDWNDGKRIVEALVMDGEPLLGTRLMQGLLLQAEISEGGQVQLETL